MKPEVHDAMRWQADCQDCGLERLVATRIDHAGRALCDQCASRPHRKPTATGLDVDRPPADRADDNPLQTRGVDLGRVQPFRWAWHHRLLLGYLNLIVGDEGVGKGTLIAWLVAQLTRGKLPGDLQGQPVRVLMVGDEDGFDNVTVPRLYAAGADLALVSDLPVGDDGPLDIKRDAGKIRALVRAEGFQVMVFDQLLDNLGVQIDDWRSKQVRDAVAPLRRLAAELDIAPVAALHTNKSKNGSFRTRVAGTQAFNALSRSSLLIAEHPDDPDLRVLARGKGNYSARPLAVTFRIDSRRVDINGHEHVVGAAADVHEDDEVTVDDLLGTPSSPTSKAGTARGIIADALADGEWHEAQPIRLACMEAGVIERAVARAADELGVERKRATGYQAGSLWRLPLARGGTTNSTTSTTGTNGASIHAIGASSANQPRPARTLADLTLDEIAAAFPGSTWEPAA